MKSSTGKFEFDIPCEEEQDACNLTRLNVTENGIYMPDEADGYYQVDVNVSGYPEPTGTINITQNGTSNVKDYASANVNVPNSYTASDEGKVVSSGALVAQGSQTITQDGTYDTTLINELIANIGGGGGGQFPFVDEAYNSNNKIVTIITTSDLVNIDLFNTNYARTRAPFVGRIKKLSSADVGTTLAQYIQSSDITPTSLEYYGNVYGNTSMISALGLVLLADLSQGGASAGNVLSDSLANYNAVILQGIYSKQRTSGYNTSMLYTTPELNHSYWAGMKDRNSNYDCNVTFTSNTTCSLSGNQQVIIYGVL